MGPKIVKSRTKVSQVWNFFQRNIGENTATCLTCKKEVKTSGNTTNLLDHLKRNHRGLLENGSDLDISLPPSRICRPRSSVAKSPKPVSLIKPVFKPIAAFLTKDRRGNRERGSEVNVRKKEIDQALVDMIIADYRPFSIVEDLGFKELIAALDPSYELPSKAILRDILFKNCYKECQRKLADMLSEVEHLAVSTDFWVSTNGDSFLTLTCHFINNESEVLSAVLGTVQMEENHSAEHIVQRVNQQLAGWNARNKIVALVTDNSVQMIKAAELLKINHVPCFAHTLNMVVQNVIKTYEPGEVLQRCKSIVNFFQKNNAAMENLRKEQLKTSQIPLEVIQEEDSMWISSYEMVKRMLKLADPITLALTKTAKAPAPLNVGDIEILEEYMQILSVFDETVRKLCSDEVTGSLPIPATHEIHVHLSNLQVSTSEGQELLSALLGEVESRLFGAEELSVFQLATILDPRLKHLAFRSVDTANQAVTLLQNELWHLLQQPSVSSPVEGSMEVASSSSSLFKFMAWKANENGAATGDSMTLVQQYLERVNSSADSNPLFYWKVNGDEWKGIPKKYLCVPATSLPADRIFTKTGQHILAKRSTLKAKYVDMMLFLSQNKYLLQ